MNILLLIVATLLSSNIVFAQQSDELYLTADEVPNAVYWLPEPPAPGSSQFLSDISQYFWGKQQRLDSLRAKKAIREVVSEVADMAVLFSEAFGMEISEKKTPAIFYVVKRGVLTMRLAGRGPKNHYMRPRPYMYFNEPTLMPKYEEEHRSNGSYPSGHTIRAWAMALLLAEINPAAQDALLKYGYEWGQSRVIAGYHWQSDIEASKAIIAGCFARLHADESFLADMKKARAEFKRLSTAKKKSK